MKAPRRLFVLLSPTGVELACKKRSEAVSWSRRIFRLTTIKTYALVPKKTPTGTRNARGK